MLQKALQSSTIPVLEQVVKFAQARHGVLAGNLANIDTPGYRTRDLSPAMFQARLREAMHTRDEQQQPISQVPMSTSDPLAKVTQSLDGILYHDNNNRSLEHQVAAIADNELQHNMALALLSKQFQLLQTAVSERV